MAVIILKIIPKFTQIGIFSLKVYHLAALVQTDAQSL
jgi:hypothetical protein